MTFKELHYEEAPLLLPNAWDVGSALGFANAGFAAIGTTSFGVNAAVGVPDAARSSRKGTEALVRRLSSLPVYISADIEDGYSDDPAEVADFVATLGADGVNIEDSTDEELIDPALHAAKVAAIKASAPEVFVNARVETYWLKKDADVDRTVARAKEYADAGADGIFIPGATEPSVLERITSAIHLPVNVLVVPDLTLNDLRNLGVRRVSTGSLPYRAAIDAAVAVALAVRNGAGVPTATPYAEAQQRLVDYSRRAANLSE